MASIPQRPLLVIVNGAPASGKSTLASQVAAGLGVPCITKDDLKEELYDALGVIERAISRHLGEAAMRLMYTSARRILEAGIGVVIEANFYRGVSENDLGEVLALADGVMLHCAAPPEVLKARYAERAKSGERHPVHDDANRAGDVEKDVAGGVYDPLDLDVPLIRVDSTADFDPSVAEIISELQRQFPTLQVR
jgi:predicted kinase